MNKGKIKKADKENKPTKKTVVFGWLGERRDADPAKWRPTVALGEFKDLSIERLELFYMPREKNEKIRKQVIADLKKTVSPRPIEVVEHPMPFDVPWDFDEVYGKLFDFMKDYPFDLEKERYMVHIKTGTHIWQICFFLLAESRFFPGKILQSFDPNQPEEKVIGQYKIIDFDLSKRKQIMSRFEQARQKDIALLKLGIETRNKEYNNLIEEIGQVAVDAEQILLLGGTGVGKTQLARNIFKIKQLEGEFVVINVATLQGDQLKSALFGHVKGAFTGADKDRCGLMLKAHNGLLFLDEIGELGLEEQAMLLDAMENKYFYPVGSDKQVYSNFQLIAATNQNLDKLVAVGKFREDLLARINLWTFTLPGLKNRKEDIEPNIAFELKNCKRKAEFDEVAWERFKSFANEEASWRSNFRDLKAAITRMAALSDNGYIRLETVIREIDRLKKIWNAQTKVDDDMILLQTVLGEELVATLDLFDAVQLAKVIRVCRESKTYADAGRKLFQQSQKNKTSENDGDRLAKYLKKYGLNWTSVTDAASV